MKKFFLEGYGCSLNISETQKIDEFLESNNFERTDKLNSADFVIINTCSVKQVTEQRMFSRIEFFLNNKKSSSKIIVFGCLAAHKKKDLLKKFPTILFCDTSLESLCLVLNIKKRSFSPKLLGKKSNPLVSIIPVSVGCLGNCTYCATKIARPNFFSYSIKEIDFAFKSALKSGSKEIWLTSQDLGCYGFDIKTDIVELLKVLLKNKGEYRIRLGMMNPNFLKKISGKLIPLFSDDRLYKFLHVPVQSGSNRVLKLMNRGYKNKDFVDLVNLFRKKVKGITFSTDIIVGFPTETEKDFEKTLLLLKKTTPEVVNISRFAKRDGTKAAVFSGQLSEATKKDYSRKLTKFCDEYMLVNNKKRVGEKVRVLVSEKKSKNLFVARTNNYRPVNVGFGYSSFVDVEIVEAFPHFFKGETK